jgi:uncharacterized membrane protein (DUF373 family)
LAKSVHERLPTKWTEDKMEEDKYCVTDRSEGIAGEHEDPLIHFLHKVIRHVVRILAVLMVLIIIWGILDVLWVFYERLIEPPYFLLNISDILATFGAFLAVLIAIEIFLNITLYLRDDIIHVRLVVATALMAIARKVIVLDFKVVSAQYVYASAAVVVALGIAYWLVSKSSED